MEEKDLYQILGVDRNATADDIRSAYRKLAREHHPDVNPNNPEAEERFKGISAAHTILSNEDKRKRYDEFGMAGLQDGFDPEQARAYQQWSHGAGRSPGYEQSFHSEMNLDDLLSQFFQNTQQTAGPRAGGDAIGNIQVEFLDVVRGCEVTVEFEGKGRLRVKIPAGADDGTRIRLPGQGQQGAEGGAAGDLYLTLDVRPHPFFTRKQADLFVDVPVTIPELVLGASIDVPTPDGSVSMKVPPRTAAGTRLRLRNKGALRKSGGQGDLYVTLMARLPECEDVKLEELARELESLYGDDDVRANLKEMR